MAAKGPSISVNKLAEFMFARAGRQREILKDCKYPTEFKGMYYREADESISLAISRNLEDLSSITNQIAVLEQAVTDKIGTQRRITANIDALDGFMGMIDDIDLKGAEPSLGTHQANKLVRHGVSISVRPQVILRKQGRAGAMIGALKLHFPKNYSLNEDSAGVVSAVLQEWSRSENLGSANAQGDLCCVVDVGSRRYFPGVKATTTRLRDVDSACQNIAALWPTI